MNINNSKKPWQEWKNIKDTYLLLEEFKNLNLESNYIISDIIEIKSQEHPIIEKVAKSLIPWRKGPFQINNIFIDTEWKSYIKYNLIKNSFNLENKVVADIGCNNGYYMFRMLEQNPKKLIGFDPSPLYFMQFDFINSFIKSDIEFELLGVENLKEYKIKFDFIFMLGVLYHRSNPIETLKDLYASLNDGGEILIDTFYIESDEEICLTPLVYSKIKNIYFIPSIKALKNWLIRAKFKDIEIIATSITTTDEQRKTSWINGDSLSEFLDKDKTKTIEGYPPPKRVYIKAKK